MAQPYLYPYDIRTFPIPLLDNEIQIQIQQKIMEAFTMKKQSKHLLECAKRAVEIAIEQDEQAALAFLEQSAARPHDVPRVAAGALRFALAFLLTRA